MKKEGCLLAMGPSILELVGGGNLEYPKNEEK